MRKGSAPPRGWRMMRSPWATWLGRAAGLAARASTARRSECRTCVLSRRLLHPEDQPVVGVVAVVDAVLVGDERVEQGAHLEEGVPVLGSAGQAAQLQAEHDADVVQRPLGPQPLEAGAALGRAAALAQVIVDREHALARPAECYRLVGEGVLPGGGLAVLLHLPGRGLAD